MPQETQMSSEQDSVVDSLQSQRATQNNIPSSVHPDSGIISMIQSIAPKYAGYNQANLRSRLLQDSSFLDEISNKVVVNSMSSNETLANLYENKPEEYSNHVQKVREYLEFNLANDVYKGETIRQSVVDRTFKVRTTSANNLAKKGTFKSPYDSIINREAQANGLDPDLVRAVISKESSFNPNSVSSKGAIGLMQLMPDTAEELGVDPNDPEDNIRGGVKYLADQIRNFNSVEMGLAAYNAGPTRVRETGDIPEFEETQNYIQNIIGNYQEIKSPRFDYDLPISDYREIAMNDPDKYSELRVVDEDGNFIYDNETGTNAFTNRLLVDEQLHKELIGDRYDQFLDVLANSNNTGAIDESDVDELSRAWAVYDQFGSEGLTNVLNVEQHYQRGVPLEEQEQSVQKGIDYIRNTNKNGLTVQEYIGGFFGDERSPLGKYEVTPVVRSREMDEEVPQDLNNYTKFQHSAQDEIEGTKGLLDAVRKKSDVNDTYKPSFFDKSLWYRAVSGDKGAQFSLFGEAAKGAISGLTAIKEALDVIPGDDTVEDAEGDIFGPIRNLFPETATIELDEQGQPIIDPQQDYETAPIEEVLFDLQNGHDTVLSRSMKIDILNEAKSENGAFSVTDLMRTIMANHDNYSEKNGNPIYEINYENADLKTKLAIDAFRFDSQLKNTIQQSANGNLLFDPQYYERIKNEGWSKYAISMDWEQRVVTDDNGNTLGYVEAPAEQGIGSSVANTVSALGYQAAKFADDMIIKPAVEKSFFPLIDRAQEILGEGALTNFENGLKQSYQQGWREQFDTHITQEMKIDDPGDVLPTVAAWTAPLGMYIYGASKLGAGSAQAPWKFIEGMAKARSAMSGEAASLFLQPKLNTKLGGAAFRMYANARNRLKPGIYGELALGSAQLEFLAGDQWSIFGTGLADVVVNAGVNKLGKDDTVSLQRKYQTSDRLTQIGADILAMESAGLLLDNLFGLARMGVSSKGLNFNRSTGEYEKVSKAVFASDSRRFVHDLFNGLQDAPIGNLGESLAARFTGRSFVSRPQNAETLSDVVVGFGEKAGPLYNEIKKLIRDSIEGYDKRLGGDLRLSQDQITQRVEQVYSEFMDASARNIKGVLETNGAETLPLRIANLLEKQAPRVRGTVPYVTKEGVEKRLMTLGEAQELASRNNRYIVKPNENNGKYARVYEVEDGLWTHELSSRIRNLYKDSSPQEVVERAKRRAGIGRTNVGLTEEELERSAQIESDITGVYGQEVDLDGTTGYIIDLDESGFIVRDVEDNVHTGVQIDGLDDIVERASGRSQLSEETIETASTGKSATTTGNQIDDVSAEFQNRQEVRYPGVDSDARQILRNQDEGAKTPSKVSKNLRDIARRNGVKIGDSDDAEVILARLRKQALPQSTRDALERIGRANEITTEFKSRINTTKNVGIDTNSSTFKSTGLGEIYANYLNTFAGYVRKGKGMARKFAKLLGVDNTKGYRTFARNQTSIGKFDPKKVGEKGLKTNYVFKWNTDGVDEHYITIKGVNAEDTPSVWVKDRNGNLLLNEKWRRIEPNVTLNPDGTLPLFKRVEVDGEHLYTRVEPGDDGVFINVQKPTTNTEASKNEIVQRGIDAIEKDIDGVKHYKLINEGQQTIDPSKMKEAPTKIYNSTTTVSKPSELAETQAKNEAKESIAQNLTEAGMGRSLAYGLAGAVLDNLLGTVPEGNPNDEDSFKLGLFAAAGALMGSRWVRTNVKSAFNGFTKEPIKDIFDNSFSTLFKVEQDVKGVKKAAKYDITYDPLNDKEKALAHGLVDALKKTKGAGVNKWNDLRNNEYFKSTWSWLSDIKHPKAKKFLEVMEGMNRTVNDIAGNAPTRFKALTQGKDYSDGAPSIFADMRKGVEESTVPYERFVDIEGPEMVRRVFKNQSFERDVAEQEFDNSFFRLLNSGAEVRNGELVLEPTPTVQRMYDSPKGEQYRELDSIMMEDPKFRDFLESHKNFFTDVMNRWNTQLDNRMNRAFANLSEADRGPFRSLLDTDMTYGEWVNTLSNKKQQEVRRIKKNNELVNKLLGYHHTKLKFTNLDRRYFPQIVSDTKHEAAFKRYIRQNRVGDLSEDLQGTLRQRFAERRGIENLPEEQQLREFNAETEGGRLHLLHEDDQKAAFSDHMARVLYDLNSSSRNRRILNRYDPDAQNYGVRYFKTKDDAERELNTLSAQLADTREYEDLAGVVQGDRDRFIQSETERVRDRNGEIVLDENNDPVTTTKYYLELPEDMDTNIFELGLGNYTGNIAGYRDFYEDLQNHAVVRNSNFLEKPRVDYLPHELLETNINRVRRQYSVDVGRRIHNAENRMFDLDELENEYLVDINRYLEKDLGFSKPRRDEFMRRIETTYNVANNIIEKSGNELRKEARFRSTVDLFKNALFSRFGYGFGNYNMFEWFVVGPNISSFSSMADAAKLFTTNKQALANVESILRNRDIVRKEIGAVNPDFERFGMLTDSDALNYWGNKARRLANFVGDFSVSKTIGGKLLGWDVRDWGMARLATDSFMGSNYVSTSLNAMGAMSEARYFGKILKSLNELPEGAEKVVQRNGRTYTEGDVRRKLSQLGIKNERQAQFSENLGRFEDLVDEMRSTDQFDISVFAQDRMPEHATDVLNIMQMATETFHGTNKMYRPLGWHSPLGKGLSTYSTYPFNFSLQNLQRRIRRPIEDWQNQYGQLLGENAGQVNMMRVLYDLKEGNIQALRNRGLTDEAISNIPVDAYRSIMKLMGSTLGVSVASYLTIDGMNDLLTYPINKELEKEQWKRLRRWNVINPNAPQSEQVTWNDLDEEFGIDSFMNITKYMLGTMARTSTFGRYGDMLQQSNRLSRDGLLSLTPLTGMADQTFRDANRIMSEPISSYPREMPNTMLNFVINNSPIIGANVFGELRRGLYEQLSLKEGNRIRLQDETTGEIMEIEDIDTTLE